MYAHLVWEEKQANFMIILNMPYKVAGGVVQAGPAGYFDMRRIPASFLTCMRMWIPKPLSSDKET